MNKKLLIFTDMDGTLLDHHTYSFEAAVPMLQILEQRDFPVMPNTSKTKAELAHLRHEIKLDTPFIVENGAAIYIPEQFFPKAPTDAELVEGYYCKSFSQPRAHWLDLLASQPDDLRHCYRGFSEMSNEEISLATNLSIQDSTLANTREFSEPLKWLGNDAEKAEFSRRMKAQGANVLQGGRFVHISGKCNKGVAMRWLSKEFARQFPDTHFKSVALGDSYNDNDMLEAADIAVQIKTSKHDFPTLFRTDALWQSTRLGPKGWHECLEQILTHEFN